MSRSISTIHKRSNPKRSNRNNIYLLFIILIVFLVVNIMPMDSCSADSKQIQEGIANEIIRLHVIANSDSRDDQALKLKVKDAVVKAMAVKFKNINSKERARQVIIKNIPEIKKIALHAIRENGYQYGVKVSLSNTYFPTKIYGDMTFPPGVYEALRVQIGGAEGRNWWCVMFPPLCFVDTTYSIVPKESKHKLKKLLTNDEYNTILGKEKVEVKVKFRFIEIIKDIF
ncbi:stage II sporulation protein R [Anaeromicropila herbilytica]|uniref:Stage II sporulation protein R n=1 Tax=Anaeromicropila herbilytica TaxID=2785025 RepID=A0A7R7EHH4_9FIRM|nr:stage II sporulation protein R [Anaeromicropila herbilytica]BCN28815.1 stage II sporulation protein R [Anaeromicropila herbilytica]